MSIEPGTPRTGDAQVDCSRVHPGSKPLRWHQHPDRLRCRRGERQRFSASPEPFVLRLRRNSGPSRTAVREICFADCSPRNIGTEVGINPDVKLSDLKLNYDGTSPRKRSSGASVGPAGPYSVGSDAGSAYARVAVAAELPRDVPALRHPTTQRCGGSRDSRNQPDRRKTEAPFGSPTNE
jgi:hypothetical protein